MTCVRGWGSVDLFFFFFSSEWNKWCKCRKCVCVWGGVHFLWKSILHASLASYSTSTVTIFLARNRLGCQEMSIICFCFFFFSCPDWLKNISRILHVKPASYNQLLCIYYMGLLLTLFCLSLMQFGSSSISWPSLCLLMTLLFLHLALC